MACIPHSTCSLEQRLQVWPIQSYYCISLLQTDTRFIAFQYNSLHQPVRLHTYTVYSCLQLPVLYLLFMQVSQYV